MKVKICKNDFSLQWQGTYYLALVDYPEINKWENVYGECVTSDYLSHTCTVETAKEILKSGKLLSATKAFGLTGKQLVNDKRNAAGDPADYFDYVMFGWSNTTSGYRLAMERLLERNPTEVDLEEAFIPGVSFHFRYETIVNQKGYVFDGYHAAKVKDEVLLDLNLCVCIIPNQNKKEFEGIIPNYLKNRIHYLDYQNDGLVKWNDKVYEKVLEFDGGVRTTTSIL